MKNTLCIILASSIYIFDFELISEIISAFPTVEFIGRKFLQLDSLQTLTTFSVVFHNIKTFYLTFCGILARADAITLALSSDMLLIIDPRENTTIPLSPELWTNSSISCEKKNVFHHNRLSAQQAL